MGVVSSKVKRGDGGKTKKKKLSPLEKRIIKALQKVKNDMEKDGSAIKFERILLKFGSINKVLKKCRKSFNAIDKDKSGMIDLDELHLAISDVVGGSVSKEETEALFEISDLNDDGHEGGLDAKEFIVLCTITFVLDQTSSSPSKSKALLARSKIKNDKEFRDSMMCIVQAYLAFDPDAKGYFLESELKERMEKKMDGEKGHRRTSDIGLLLTEERWKELDFDESGEVDFQEFVYAFSKWVQYDEED